MAGIRPKLYGSGKKIRYFDIVDESANFKEGRYKTSINRSYYAALNAARALLILEGANPETHEGAITMLSLRIVKPGLLPTDIIKSFKVLLSRRTDVDYGDFETISTSDAEDSIKITEEMIKKIDSVRQDLLKSLSHPQQDRKI
jgi:uncharacterized protein (UPF0332 family)